MADTKIKISHILDSQIPDFIHEENPLFKEFLNQYYISQEHEYGNVDLAENITDVKNISNFIKKNMGGLLLIDYGDLDKKMKNTLQAVSNHKFANILDNIGEVDITHNINFELFKKFTHEQGGLDNYLDTQKNFLIKMGIKQRAELISKDKNFSKKADIFYRLNRLIDEKQMGTLFKVMFVKNKKNKFNLGF